MRNITIARAKSFVGSLAKLKVYIEDHARGELTISDVPCRKLGDIKNGETKTFIIDDQSAKVFVIPDKLSRNFCNEFYQLPFGQEDIFLIGRCHFHPFSGNAFRFDNNDTEEVIANRKKGSKKGLIILIVCAIIGFLVGYLPYSDIIPVKEKDFTCDEMSITLTNRFRASDVEGVDYAFESDDIFVTVIRESHSLLEGLENYSIEEYSELVKDANDFDFTVLNDDGIMYLQHEAYDDEEKDTYLYLNYLYKSDDAFWMVQFVLYKDELSKHSDKISEWAHSVKFS